MKRIIVAIIYSIIAACRLTAGESLLSVKGDEDYFMPQAQSIRLDLIVNQKHTGDIPVLIELKNPPEVFFRKKILINRDSRTSIIIYYTSGHDAPFHPADRKYLISKITLLLLRDGQKKEEKNFFTATQTMGMRCPANTSMELNQTKTVFKLLSDKAFRSSKNVIVQNMTGFPEISPEIKMDLFITVGEQAIKETKPGKLSSEDILLKKIDLQADVEKLPMEKLLKLRHEIQVYLDIFDYKQRTGLSENNDVDAFKQMLARVKMAVEKKNPEKSKLHFL